MLPIKRVVLYKHGMGHFERTGTLSGSEKVTLAFRSAEVNDVLKSFTFLDAGKGSVSSISYDASKPLEKRLEDVFFRLGDSDNLSELVGQLKGAAVEVESAGGTVAGTVMGTQTRTVVERERQVEQQQLVLLEAGERVCTIPFDEVRWLRPTDEALARELRFYLDTVFAATRKDTKNLTIYATGTGKREVTCSYVVECPVWKTTYRILVDEGAKPLLQGWAIVDNVMEDDWRDVALTLVSGLPVSFRNDLYTPRYVTRPEVAVRTDMGLRPVETEEAMPPVPSLDSGAEMEMVREDVSRERRTMAMPVAAKMMMRTASPRAMAAAARESFEARTVGRDVGEMFVYDVTEPVTVLRDQSALVPILQSEVPGSKVLLYNHDVRESNPMACVRLSNESGLTLEEGPATVFEGGTYVGECMLPFLKKGETRMLPYAVELGVRVTRTESSQPEPVREVLFEGGALIAVSYRRRECAYAVAYPKGRAYTLVIEHPRQYDFELTSEPKPVEETGSFRRFELSLPAAGSSASLKVAERKLERTTYLVRTLGEKDLAFYYESNLISGAVLSELRAVLERYRSIAGLDAERARLEKEREGIFGDQNRLKENLSSLGESTAEAEVRAMYVRKFKDQEKRLDAIQARFEALEKERKEIEAKISKMCEGLGPLARKEKAGKGSGKRANK